jgi:CHAD domain-containing protein
MSQSSKWIEGFGPDSDARALALAALENRLSAVSYWLPAAAYCAEHDVEHVHHLRVSTRRALAALKLFRDWLPPKRAGRVKNQLKKVRQAAGEARDLDVFAERLKGEHQSENHDRVELVVAEVAHRRRAVQPEIERVADRLRRDDRLVRMVGKLLARIPRPGGENGAQIPLRTWAAWRLAEVADELFQAAPDDLRDTAALHRFRIAGKRLRYVIELLAGGLNAEVRETHYPVVETLQEHLGKINDHAWAAAELRDLVADSTDPARNAAFQAAAQRESERLEAALREFHDWWTPDRVQALRSGLGCEQGQKPSRERTVLVS